MQQNWYAVYTKPNQEKKVSVSLSRKGIENFCPLNYKENKSFLRGKVLREPLFKSYVFVKTDEFNIMNISKKVNGILSVLYWMNKPAVINDDDVNAIKDFENNLEEIKVEKYYVNLRTNENIPDFVSFNTTSGKVLFIKNRVLKINLPSIGYTLVAKIKDESLREGQSFVNKRSLVSS